MAFYLYKKLRDKRTQKGEGEPWSDPVPLDGMADSEHQRPSSAEQLLIEQTDAEQKRAKREMRMYRWRLIAGLFIPATVQALNTTMIAGALPYIASDFGELVSFHCSSSPANRFKTSYRSSIG